MRGPVGRPRWWLEVCSPREGKQELGIHSLYLFPCLPCHPPHIKCCSVFQSQQRSGVWDKLFSSTWDPDFCKSEIGFQSKTIYLCCCWGPAPLVSILAGVKLNCHVLYCSLHALILVIVLVAVSFRNWTQMHAFGTLKYLGASSLFGRWWVGWTIQVNKTRPYPHGCWSLCYARDPVIILFISFFARDPVFKFVLSHHTLFFPLRVMEDTQTEKYCGQLACHFLK